MADNGLTILGGGNTAFSVAAKLQLEGAAITLCEIPSFSHTSEVKTFLTREKPLLCKPAEGKP